MNEGGDSIPAGRRSGGGAFAALVRRVVGSGRDPSETDARQLLGEFEGFLSTGISVALSAVKAALGWLAGSVSLVADAINNGADIGSSLIIALSCRWSRKPGDRRHPFGHGRMETVATLILSCFLIAVALQVAASGLHRLLRPRDVEAPAWLLTAVALTIGLKSWLAVFARTAARMSRSRLIEADAWNHLFDIAATSLVFLALLGARIGFPRMDGWAAIGVAGFIAWTGVRYTRSALNTLIGEAPDAAELARIRSLVASARGVRSLHDVLVHSYGDARLISFHVEVDANLTLLEAHAIAEDAEARVARETGAKVIAHVDPIDRSHGDYPAAAAALRAYVDAHDEVASYHDLRLSGPAGDCDLAVDVVLHTGTPAASEADLQRLRDRLRDAIRRALPGVKRIDLGFEVESGASHEQRRSYPP